MLVNVLKDIGLSDKEVDIYLTILQLGPSPVRRLAERAGINRGTAYDILKSLQDRGLVSYYDRSKRRYFVAENPDKLRQAIDSRQHELVQTLERLDDILPELQSIYNNAGDKPVSRYYEGSSGVKTILMDVIETMKRGDDKEYYVYSSAGIRKYLYEAFPNFNNERLVANIRVKVLAIGEGGELAGLDERRWLTKDEGAPTYILIYTNKVAMISVDSADQPRGVLIEDPALFQTHKKLFEWSWDRAR